MCQALWLQVTTLESKLTESFSFINENGFYNDHSVFTCSVIMTAHIVSYKSTCDGYESLTSRS